MEIFPVYHDIKPIINKFGLPKKNDNNPDKNLAGSSVEKIHKEPPSVPITENKPFQSDYVTENFRPFRSFPVVDK